MTTALLEHKVLSRRRLTRAGWITIVADLIEEKADRPERIHEDTSWPATSTKPALRDGCWLDGTWPMLGPTETWWGRGLHVELGGRVVFALAMENRRLPERAAA